MPHPSTHPAIRRVAIVGAGTIGASWAALFLAHGLEVVVSDPAPDAEPLTRERVRAAWPVLAELGRVAAGANPDALRFEPDLEAALKDADFVRKTLRNARTSRPRYSRAWTPRCPRTPSSRPARPA